MSVKVTWAPSPESDVASYDLEWAPNLVSPVTWTLIVNIPNNQAGPNFDTITGTFFYSHADGVDTTYYRLYAYDTAGNKSAPSTPFKAPSGNPAIPNNVKVDHNYPTPASLRYQTAGGVPIEGAVVRIFKKADFDVGNTSIALATTFTNARGEWVNPIFLTTGFTYTILFAKEGLYGPDSREVIV
jgi:hypothetical protein